MNVSIFVAVTDWAGILAIIFGLLTGRLDNNFTTWFMFLFLVIVGILCAGWMWQKK